MNKEIYTNSQAIFDELRARGYEVKLIKHINESFEVNEPIVSIDEFVKFEQVRYPQIKGRE